MLTAVLVVFLLYEAILALYLLTVHRALITCAPQNRTMAPGKVWLQLIPVFGLAWHFVNVKVVAESFENEYRSRGLSVHRPHQSLGISMGACLMVGYGMIGILYLVDPGGAGYSADSALSLTDSLRTLAGFIGLAGTLSTALYWMRVHRTGRSLASSKPAAGAAAASSDKAPRQGSSSRYQDCARCPETRSRQRN